MNSHTLESFVGNTPLVRLKRIPGARNAERVIVAMGSAAGSYRRAAASLKAPDSP